MRTSEINRVTAETDITLTLELEGRGASDIDTGVGFLDHMLTLFAKHGRFDLKITAKGDNYVDDHHTVEDVGIALGQAFAKALSDKRGIRRYGDCIVPMDEALIMSAVGMGLFAVGNTAETENVEAVAKRWKNVADPGSFRVNQNARSEETYEKRFYQNGKLCGAVLIGDISGMTQILRELEGEG